MAKRRAEDQIKKGQRLDDSSDEDSQDDNRQAPPDVLAKRKIAVPRTRLHKPAAPVPSAKANPFGELGKPINSQTANPFSSLGNQMAGSQTSSLSIGSTFGNSGSGRSTDGPANIVHNTKELKMRALNSNFALQVSKADKQSPFENWTQMCEKYIQYARNITEEEQKPSSSSSTSSSTASSTPPSKTPSLSFGNHSFKQFGSDDSKPKEATASTTSQITSTGFKFNGPSTSNASTFNFGDKKVELKSHSSQPSGGFVFNPNGKGEIKIAPSADASAMKDDDDSSINGDVEVEDRGERETPASLAEGDNIMPKPMFSFGKTSQPKHNNKDTGAANTFGNAFIPAGTDLVEQKPAFTFGATDSSKPSVPFTFGAKPAGETTQTETKSSDAAKPNTFSFGSTDNKPAFSFGTAKTSEVQPPKPAFTFGSSASTATDDKAKSEESKFTFGSNTSSKSSTPTPFTFGSTTSNASDAGAEKPKFSFGSNSGSNNTKFTFGTGSNPFGSASDVNSSGKVDASWKPTQPIKIISEEASNPDNASSANSNGEPSEEQNDEQADLGGPGPGEENEDSVYEKKSKIFELIKGEYKPLGLGVLRLLVHKETNKARALVRAEGSGRVLLNIPIRKEFNYSTIGKGQVKVLDVKPGSDAPNVYVLRVKTEEDGNELKDKLENIKN